MLMENSETRIKSIEGAIERNSKKLDRIMDNDLVHLRDDIQNIKEDVSSVKVSVSRVETDLSWLKKYGWLIALVSIGAVTALTDKIAQ